VVRSRLEEALAVLVVDEVAGKKDDRPSTRRQIELDDVGEDRLDILQVTDLVEHLGTMVDRCDRVSHVREMAGHAASAASELENCCGRRNDAVDERSLSLAGKREVQGNRTSIRCDSRALSCQDPSIASHRTLDRSIVSTARDA
jgi:hypothetical protein